MTFGGVVCQQVALVTYENSVCFLADRAEFAFDKHKIDGIIIIWFQGSIHHMPSSNTMKTSNCDSWGDVK